MSNSIGSVGGYSQTMMQGMGRMQPPPNPSKIADDLFSRIDTSGKGYIEKSDLATAFEGIPSSGNTASVDDVFSSLDTDSGQKSSVDVMDLLAGIAEDARFEAHNSGRRVVFSATGDACIVGDIELLHRAFENVIRNAVKFTREDTTVEVSVGRAVMSEHVHIRVCDRGAGVPNGDLDAIFTPFHRCDNAAASGYGLGLAIARRAIELHGGSIRASNRPEGGLCIEMLLPVQRA